MFKKICLFLFLPLFLIQSPGFALDEIQISNVSVDSLSNDRYTVSASLFNQTDQPREVTLRAQIFFFEKASPKADKPAMVLRRDQTVILKENEKRDIQVRIMNEGGFPKERLRIEPEVRLRRQRVWNY